MPDSSNLQSEIPNPLHPEYPVHPVELSEDALGALPPFGAPAGVVGEFRATFEASGQVTTTGAFEIMAITAGPGNGWDFSEPALRASLALWDNVECFVDHELILTPGSKGAGHSLRDLAGMCHSPVWDDSAKGVRLNLRPMGPSGPLLVELGRQMLADAPGAPGGVTGPAPRVGFSADVIFTAQAKKVTTILRVLSVDLVFNPARGGAFLRALNSVFPDSFPLPVSGRGQGLGPIPSQKESIMPESTPSTPKPDLNQEQLTKDQAAIRSLLEEQTRQQALAAEAEKTRAVRAQMCSYLLDSGLAASKLPTPAADRIRKQFKDQVFEPADLQTAIDDTRAMLSEISGAQVVQGPGRIHAMFDSGDRLQAAMDDLLGAPRDKGKENIQAPYASGIRELYLSLTGDYDLHGGYYPDRVQ